MSRRGQVFVDRYGLYSCIVRSRRLDFTSTISTTGKARRAASRNGPSRRDMGIFSRTRSCSTTTSSISLRGKRSQWIPSSESSFKQLTVLLRMPDTYQMLRLRTPVIPSGALLETPHLITLTICPARSMCITVQGRFGPSRVVESRTTLDGAALRLPLIRPAHHLWWLSIKP